MNPNLGIQTFYYLLKFLNLITFSLNLKNLVSKPSKKSICYSIVFCVIILIHKIFIGDFANKLNRSSNSSSNSFKDSKRDLFVPTLTIVVICIAWSFFTNKLALKLIQNSKLIHQRISDFGVPWNWQQKINKVLFRFFFFQLFKFIVDYNQVFASVKSSIILIIIYTPILGIKFLYLSGTFIKYDITLILLKSSFAQINKIINEKFVKINNFPNCDEIDELAKIYFNLCEIYKIINKLFSVPIILIVGFVFFLVESLALALMLFGNFNNSLLSLFSSILILVWMFIIVRDLTSVFCTGAGVLRKVSKIRKLNSPLFYKSLLAITQPITVHWAANCNWNFF